MELLKGINISMVGNPGGCNLLLEQDGTETGIESTNTLVLQHLAESTNETVGISWLRDQTNTGGLKRAKSNIGEEFCDSGRGQVDSRLVVNSVLVSDKVDGLLLEQFITSELECALKEITSSSWTETSSKSTNTLVGNDLSETTDKTFVICDRVELDSGLDTVKGKFMSA
jgi:hypothetical protein